MTVEHHIHPLVLCTACGGELYEPESGEDCGRCAVDGVATGVDPSSRCGCVEDVPRGAVIDLGTYPGFRPA